MAENGKRNRGGRRKGEAVFVAALACGKTVRDAAKLAAIGERTAYRRASEPATQQAVAEARSAILGRTIGRMTSLSIEAAETLRRLLNAESEAVCLGAARSVLELGVRLREATELAERLAEIERRVRELLEAKRHGP